MILQHAYVFIIFEIKNVLLLNRLKLSDVITKRDHLDSRGN